MERTVTDSPAATPELEAAAHMLAGKVTELMAVTAGLALNHVLHSGSVVIGTDGYTTLNFRVPMAHVAVIAAGASGDVTAVAGPAGSDAAPTSGKGVVEIPTTLNFVSVPMVGPTLTIWGTPGDVVWVGAWSRPLPPGAG